MLNSKQRAHLKSLSSKMPAIFQIGKSSISPELITSIDEALEKRELVKLAVLNNCMDDVEEIADTISGRTNSEVVFIVGKKIVLFRKSKKKPTIELP